MPPSPKNTVFKVYETPKQQDPQYDVPKPARPSSRTVGLLVFILTAVLLSLGYYSKRTLLASSTAPEWIHAVTVLHPDGDSGVNGTVHFVQSVPLGRVKITGEIRGLKPNALRGFHIHEYGDLSSGCASTGSHYNPTTQTHGAPTDTIRHVGDLGNIKSNKHGVAQFEFEDSVVSLSGVWSVVGRAVVVHVGVDDLGRGDNNDSKKTGNAGGRAACGVIGLTRASD